MGLFEKIKKITKDGIEEIKNMPLTKKEKELNKKEQEKQKLIEEKQTIEKRLLDISDELEIIDSYIAVFQDEIKKMKK